MDTGDKLALSGPIQRIASGLLGFFQLKSPSGLNPQWLRTDVQPSLDLLDWYLQTNAQADLAGEHELTLGAGNQGFQDFAAAGPILVPQNEVWRVHLFSIITSPLSATDHVMFQGAIRQNPISVQRQWAIGEPCELANAAAGDRAIWTGRDFWALPNDSIGLYLLRNNLAGAETYAGYIRYTVCRI